ncbi:putative clathrin assembly protein [Acorus gramineus]|uniref:Clathrin assembly protein n=1 Tax=Acorus gramineus TaxID=55184 RepID=A0AAV9BNE2_ACOGR|nr:putative clathrin assembly protein [Acorus gramineus]
MASSSSTTTTPTRLWRRAAAAVKDQRSICLARISRRRGFRLPDLETAVIKATSHDDRSVDYKNAQRVFAWARTSPAFLKPLMFALSRRMERTRSWVVALKGLMLLHGMFCSKAPALRTIGRLPFDLSSFADRSPKNRGFSAFVRAYFAFLDQRSAYLSQNHYDNAVRGEGVPVELALKRLQRWQFLLDLLIQIRPYGDGLNVGLVLEAMDCVVVEIFEVYSGICNGIARHLTGILVSGREDAVTALRILQKSTSQGARLSTYFELCRSMGVLNATEFPKVERVAEEDIRDLERMVYGDPLPGDDDDDGFVEDEEVGRGRRAGEDSKEFLSTIVTDEWVIFEDEPDRGGPVVVAAPEKVQRGLYEDWEGFEEESSSAAMAASERQRSFGFYSMELI